MFVFNCCATCPFFILGVVEIGLMVKFRCTCVMGLPILLEGVAHALGPW